MKYFGMVNEVKISLIEHRGEMRIKVLFERSKSNLIKIRRVPGRAWSRTKYCWHVPCSEAGCRALKTEFEEVGLAEGDAALAYKIRQNAWDQGNSLPKSKDDSGLRIEPLGKEHFKVFIPQERLDWRTQIKSRSKITPVENDRLL